MVYIISLFMSLSFAAGLQKNLKEVFDKADRIFNPKVCKMEAAGYQRSIFKNTLETKNFIKCSLQERNEAAYEKYRVYIYKTARHFGIEDSFMQCLFLQESKYDSHARSPVGAIGISQFIEDNRSFIDGIIQGGGLSADRRKKLQSALQTEDGSEARKAKARLVTYNLNQMWNGHFINNKIKPPQQLTTAMLKQPEYAIPASALYLNYTFEFLFQALSTMGKNPMNLSDQEWFDLNIIAAGSYNMGHGRAVKILQSIKSKRNVIAEWKSKLMAHNDETNQHIVKIQNCLQAETKPKECR